MEESTAALHRAVDFFRQYASAGGGYVYRISADLSKREAGKKVGPTTAWVHPPSTPSVGQAYLSAFQLTGDPLLLDAARATADALIQGQLRSGGWDERIEFSSDVRSKYAYRIEGVKVEELRNKTNFDDDVSQSAIGFLMRLDQELLFQDPVVHEAVTYALDAVIKAQYANGAWPQRYSDFPLDSAITVKQANLPKKWSRVFPDVEYEGYFTVNDDVMISLIALFLNGWDIYGDPRYLSAAQMGGEFLLRAQLPEPQPGWAQQYDHNMNPAWARKFEPPAITGEESQGVMQALIMLYRRTAAVDENAGRFLEPLPRAIAYFRRSLLEDGKLARFYELGSNRPLYLTRGYELTYSPDNAPSHYTFAVRSRIDQIERELERVRQTPIKELRQKPGNEPIEATQSLARRAQEAIDTLDDRGAWVEVGSLKHYGAGDPTRFVIRTRTFIKNLTYLANWIAANQ
jgi:PelA/Pel-15E family pectate lyase